MSTEVTKKMTQKMTQKMNRRELFQAASVLVGAAALIPVMAQAERKRSSGADAKGAGPKLVDPKDAQAKAVNYVHVNTEIKDKALTADRAGVKFKDQKCNVCIFYQSPEVTVNGKKAAPCQMPFAAGKVVAADGWCSSWAKK